MFISKLAVGILMVLITPPSVAVATTVSVDVVVTVVV
jgi:hypothetical protein